MRSSELSWFTSHTSSDVIAGFGGSTSEVRTVSIRVRCTHSTTTSPGLVAAKRAQVSGAATVVVVVGSSTGGTSSVRVVSPRVRIVAVTTAAAITAAA